MLNNAIKATQVIVFTLVLSGLAQSSTLSPLPASLAQQWQQLELIGQARLKRFGFHVYDASFWMTAKPNRDEKAFTTNLSALCITYARNIRVEKLLSSTEKEWRKLGIANKHPTVAWLNQLQQIWPDVKQGDQLIFVFDPNGESAFYNQNKKLGTISDKNFGPAFLSIWLDENASYKNKRNELLGRT